jgi:hypothetical protein
VTSPRRVLHCLLASQLLFGSLLCDCFVIAQILLVATLQLSHLMHHIGLNIGPGALFYSLITVKLGTGNFLLRPPPKFGA